MATYDLIACAYVAAGIGLAIWLYIVDRRRRRRNAIRKRAESAMYMDYLRRKRGDQL